MKVMYRGGWRPSARLSSPMRLPSRGVRLHHTVTALTADPAADQRAVERVGIQRFGMFPYSWTYHMNARRFIQGAGNTLGAHTRGHNSTTHGIALIGNFEHVHQLSDQAVADLGEFIWHGGHQGWWAPVLLGGHRDLAPTACPGISAHRRIPEIRAAIGPPATFTTPNPAPNSAPKERDMFVAKNGPHYWLCSDSGRRHIGTMEQVRAFEARFGPAIEVDGKFTATFPRLMGQS